MIAYARFEGHYARSDEFQGFLAACRANPDDDTAPLVLADWLTEWTGETPYATDCAARHAEFIRAQVAPGYRGKVQMVASNIGRAGAMRFPDLTFAEPWLRGGWRAVVNSTGTGVYYRRGLPAAVKCAADDLYKAAELVKIWRVPEVFVRYGSGALGVALSQNALDEGPPLREEHCWLRAPVPASVNRWVDTTDGPPPGRSHTGYVIETVLERAFGADCGGAKFHAIHKQRWRSTHPC